MRCITPGLLLSVVWGGTASAHHGPGQYTDGTSIFLTGVVTKQRFVNPHGYVYLDVETESGEIVPWRCEIRAATVLRRSGWSEDLLKPGTKITIEGSSDNDIPPVCFPPSPTPNPRPPPTLRASLLPKEKKENFSVALAILPMAVFIPVPYTTP